MLVRKFPQAKIMNLNGEIVLLSYADDNVIIKKLKEEVQETMMGLISIRKSSSR